MMGGVRRDSSSSVVVVVVTVLLLVCTSFGVAVGSLAGFLYIDCGSNFTTVDALGISWVPDDGFITTGVNVPVVSNAFPDFPEFKTLRYFNDTRPKNCYTLQVMTNTTYLIRANFFYGGYDSAATAPSFQVAIDATVVANITKEKTNGGYEEFTVLTQNNVTYFCLLRDSSNTNPFISGLSLRPIKSYTNMDTNLVNFKYYRTLHRLNLGGPSLVRYPDDVYDRYWHGEISPYVTSTGALSNLSTTKTVTQDTFTRNVVIPTAVLQTAVSATGLNNISLMFNQSAYGFKSYLGLYLAELSSSVTSKLKRQFLIDAGPGYTTVINNLLDNHGIDVGAYWLYDDLDFTTSTSIVLYPDAFNTTYGPLLNAVEFFEIQDPAAMKTKETDAAAIEDIKATMNLLEWTGDPCLPQPHSWLTCGITSTSPFPQVLAVNLSGYQLNTTISPSFGKLGALTSLALDSCGLNGSIPDLSGLSSLKTLHLQNNILSGPVPDWLSTARNLKELFIENNNLSGNINKLRAKNGLNFRYTPGNPLLNPQAPVEPTLSTSSKLGIIIGCVLGGILALAIVIFLVVYFVCLWWRPSASKDVQVGGDTEVATLTKAKTLATPGARAFTLKEVVVASENFKTQIGKGGFGPVFYGKLVDGQEVAIKVLDIKSHQGSTEFFNEVDILSRVHHKNLVSLVGYCIDGETQMLLYEYIHQGSLHDHLNAESGKGLDWLTRLHIALNAAQGLDYLHTGCQPSMIHRDVKPSNILLTNRMESAKVSDFGLSRLTQGESDTPVSTFVKGTTGYLDPEYFTTHHVSTRSDVYSFGVVLLELITGRLPINPTAQNPLESNLCSWVRASLENGDIDKILDPNLRASQPNMEGLWKVVEVAIRSVEPKGVHRPTMSEVVDELRQAMAFEGTHSRGTSHTNTPSNLSDIKSNSYVAFDSDSQIRPR